MKTYLARILRDRRAAQTWSREYRLYLPLAFRHYQPFGIDLLLQRSDGTGSGSTGSPESPPTSYSTGAGGVARLAIPMATALPACEAVNYEYVGFQLTASSASRSLLSSFTCLVVNGLASSARSKSFDNFCGKLFLLLHH